MSVSKGGGVIQNLTDRPNDDILNISLYKAVNGVPNGNGSFDKISYNNQYKQQHYDTLRALMPKGSLKKLKAYAKSKNKSLSALTVEALEWYTNLDLSGDNN